MDRRSRTLLRLMRGQRLRFGAAIVALAAGTFFAFLVPLVCRATIDGVIAGEDLEAPAWVLAVLESLGGRSVLARNLWIAALCVLFVTGLSGLFMYLKGRWAARASEAIVRRLRDDLYDHLQHLPCAYHAQAETGDLVQRCTSDVETIRLFLSVQVVEIGRGLIMLATVMPIMFWMSPRMAMVSLALIPIIITFALVFFFKIKAVFKLADEAEGRMTTVLQENLTGIRVVRAFARGDFECEKFDARNAEHRDRVYRLIRLLAWYWSSSDFICVGQLGLSLIVGGYWVAQGQLSVGTLYAFVTYVGMLLWPVRQMGRILTDLGKALVALGRAREILDQPREIEPEDAAAATPAEPLQGRIVFDRAGFAYEHELPVLRDLSFRVKPGQTVAILGPTGSGKSTIVNLLLRLYDATEGLITVDGRGLKTLPRKFVRSQIGAVLQEPFLYSKTVRENITLAQPDVDEDSMVEAADVANIHDAILEFEKGYDTVVGEQGVTLSGGQRQRVALARALLKDPPMLILDDSLSAVDTRTEAMILDALRARHSHRTTLVIAHRLSTLMQADWIIVLEAGQIVQSGTHQTLLQEDGLYRRLWDIQGSLEEDLSKELNAG